MTPGEARVQRALEAAKAAGPGELYALLKQMPKGADLHMHLSGAIYAETFIAEAVKSGLCIAPVDPAAAPGAPAVPTPQGAVKFVPPVAGDNQSSCPTGAVPASTAFTNQKLYDALIDSFSMRAFVPSPGINGHDQFFATFDRFGGLKSFSGEWLDEVASRAAAQNEQYLEIMQTPTFSHAAALGYKLGWPQGSEHDVASSQLMSLRAKLLDAGLRDEVGIDRKELADAKARRAAIEGCDVYDKYQKEAEEAPDSRPSHGQIMEMEDVLPGCSVKIHWIYQVLRGFPPQQVFAQTLLGFEVASVDPDVVGINFVMPEDGRVSMQDYHLQMQMLDYLHGVYPHVHISLHAGELAPGMVTPDGLAFHIREAIELGHAERIGHGVDVLYESNSKSNGLVTENLTAVLDEMAAHHVDVEVNLTSNDVILGVKGKDHPLAAYRAAHVPFSLSTDDEGVSRIDLTHEYVTAVLDQNLDYAALKQSARDSLEHSFLSGLSLWAQPDDFTRRNSACSAPINRRPTGTCAVFLHNSERATEQYELERRFLDFESSLAPTNTAPKPSPVR
jgi:adenosine deaminase